MGIAFFAIIFGWSALPSFAQNGTSLTIWTYDSFISEWGPAAPIAKLYKEKTGTTLNFVAKGDGGALLATLLASGKNSDADIVIGLDDRLASRALSSGLFAPSSNVSLAGFSLKLIIDPEKRLLPFDYGNFAFIWDSSSTTPPPKSLEDLTKPEYRKKVIIMDPRTSTPGLGFLAWTEAIYGNGWQSYWKRLAPSILAMTPSWDTGYGLFTSGEAPLVLSYSTSPAYHKAYENTERYKALVFPQGHPAQVELAGALASSKNVALAEKFLAFFLSAECQALLPETQWMYPANPLTALPKSFDVIPQGIVTIPCPILNPSTDPDLAAMTLTEAPK
jgi:thiamine transport system substrate-binding protein